MERVQKIIANSGYVSRRKAEELIKEKKVKVNGKIVSLGDSASSKDVISVDGYIIKKEEKEYYLLNKPRGIITSCKDEKNRKTVIDFIPTDARIYPVGRLDYDTTGVLLLTNDGELTNLLTHPKGNIDKIYIAKVKGLVGKKEVQKLARGVMVGKSISKAKMRIKKYDKKTDTSILELVIHEGKYHQVKKMLEEIGYPTLKLHREVFAGLTTDGLKSGEYRKLSIKEVKQLYAKTKKD